MTDRPRTRVLHLADLHLGAGHAYLGPAAGPRRTEADDLLTRIADFALGADSGIGGLVIAGDLFDHHEPPEPLVESVLRDLGRLVSGGIRVLTVPGNHDEYSYPRCVYRARAAEWPGGLVQTPFPARVERWELAGRVVDLYAMAYVAGRSRAPFDRFETEPSEGVRIAVLHGSLDAPWSDRSLPLRSDALGGLGLDYVALGHIHQPIERRLDRGWACYPGRIEGSGFDDPGGAGLLVVDLAAETLRPERLPFASRPIRKETWNISGLGDEDELDSRLDGIAHPEAIVRLSLCGIPAFRLDPERVRRRHASRFFHLEVEFPEEAAVPPGELSGERTARGFFVRLSTERIGEAADDGDRVTRQAALRHGLAAFAAEGGGRTGTRTGAER